MNYEGINRQFSTDEAFIYKDIYKDISNEYLRETFILIHASINPLLSFLNKKNNGNKTYNAEQSRRLSDLIDKIRSLFARLKDTSLAFKINDHYEDIMNQCRAFISYSGGSAIPDEFPRINLVEYDPIFTLMNKTDVIRVQKSDAFETLFKGEGSYANVYKFHDTHYNETFALKRAKKNLSPKEIIRFKNEFLELSKLDSPYIVRVYNYNDQINEYTMEYVEDTLAKYMRANNNKLSIKDRVSIINQIFKAFKYIHSKELLHRDISHSNILIKTHDDGTTIVKVSDFGLVKTKDSTLTDPDSSIKGSLNDNHLNIVGFDKYEIRHEIYALIQVINFVLTGNTKGGLYNKDKNVHDFLLRGHSANIEERFGSIKEMESEFIKVKRNLL
ncbi:protein kinase family protein [Paenibacillus sp. LS1]|uniref:protein kinase family protein n=1 Tax=Paenibacillus sp. LS1 TaxID=2992120 RepID=UPI0022316826|nr:protein kinase family protein [Paenibacillus sp. LS1]MCW3793803.1 protein kinase family protein [Paenibacillus sp. LS1]